jgi:predicted solute-binding protein
MGTPARVVRAGTVDYLNARPLVHGLEHGLGEGAFELSRAVPSVLADRMRGQELDLALLPVVELAHMPELELAPGLAIASHGRARSVLLVSRRPVRSIASIALDPESRTSNVLARVLLDRVWGIAPEIVPASDDLERTLLVADAAVRIGDKALFEPLPARVHVHDLGLEWTRATGLPFVFAAWAAWPGVLDERLCRLLDRSRRAGSDAIDAIARDYSFRGRRDPELAREYLRHNIRYDLGPEELSAMARFFEAAHETGAIERVPPIRVASAPRLAREVDLRAVGPRST